MVNISGLPSPARVWTTPERPAPVHGRPLTRDRRYRKPIAGLFRPRSQHRRCCHRPVQPTGCDRGWISTAVSRCPPSGSDAPSSAALPPGPAHKSSQVCRFLQWPPRRVPGRQVGFPRLGRLRSLRLPPNLTRITVGPDCSHGENVVRFAPSATNSSTVDRPWTGN